jgi:hypothetical protein
VSRIVSQLLKLIRQAALGENPLNIVRLRSKVGRFSAGAHKIVFERRGKRLFVKTIYFTT